jgi:hypothetical protein
VDCERRAQMDSAPVCPACWARQPTSAPASTVLQTTGLVLGVLSIVPCCPLFVVSIVVNIAGIVLAKEPPARDVRWKPITGLLLTLGISLIWFILALVRMRHQAD